MHRSLLFLGLVFVWMGLGLELSGQIQSSIRLKFSDAKEDSLWLEWEKDSLAHYRADYLSRASEPEALNDYIEALNEYLILDSLDYFLGENIPKYSAWESKKEQGRFLLAWSEAVEFHSLFDSAQVILHRIVDDPSFAEAEAEVARAHFKLGVVHRLKGEYYLGTRYLHNALDHYSAIGDSLGIYESEFQIGVLNLIQGDSTGFEEAYSRALTYYEKENDSFNLALVYSIRSIFLNNQGKYEEGLAFAQKSLDIRYAMRDVRLQAESLNNASINIMGMGDLPRGKYLLEEALRKFRMGNYMVFAPTLLNNIGRMLVRSDSLEEAMPYYQEALRIAEERDQKHDIQYSNMRIARLCAKQGDYQCAYEALNKSVVLKEEILGKNQLSKINDLQARYDDEKEAQEEAFKEREREITRIRDTVIIVALILLLIGAIWLVFLTRKRGKQERMILQAQEANARQELAMAEQQLAVGRERLQDFVLRMVEKNRLVDDLESQVKTLEAKMVEKDPQQVEFESQLSEMKILTQEDWDQFRVLFKKAYPGFLDRLSREAPQLSKGETRIFVLVYLDLSTSEAASMLGISPAAVKKARYRLKKKLDLDESADLKAYIKQF